jgi:hypothetical protein
LLPEALERLVLVDGRPFGAQVAVAVVPSLWPILPAFSEASASNWVLRHHRPVLRRRMPGRLRHLCHCRCALAVPLRWPRPTSEVPSVCALGMPQGNSTPPPLVAWGLPFFLECGWLRRPARLPSVAKALGIAEKDAMHSIKICKSDACPSLKRLHLRFGTLARSGPKSPPFGKHHHRCRRCW